MRQVISTRMTATQFRKEFDKLTQEQQEHLLEQARLLAAARQLQGRRYSTYLYSKLEGYSEQQTAHSQARA